MDHRLYEPQVNPFVPHAPALAGDDSPFIVQQADKSFSAFFAPHVGQATSSSLSWRPLRVSKLCPHAWHRYSYRGILLLLCPLIRASSALGHQKVYPASLPHVTILVRPCTCRILFIYPSVKLITVKHSSARGCGGFCHDPSLPFVLSLADLVGSILDPAAIAHSRIHPQFGEDKSVQDNPCSNNQDKPNNTLHRTSS